MEWLNSSGLEGLAIGFVTFLIIGAFHPLVIKGEYYFGVKCWWAFLIVGIVAAILSIIIETQFWSIVTGVISFSSFWGILEVFEQKKRVKRGWFPMNKKRADDYK